MKISVKLWMGLIALMVMTTITTTFSRAVAADLGSTVSNTATVNYGPPTGRITAISPPAVFLVEALRTPSTIDFFRVSPNAPDGIGVQINGSDFAPTVDANGSPVFQPVGPPVTAGGVVLDFSAPATLVPAQAYYPGELIVVRVTDLGQNGDPHRIETVTITVESGAGDLVTLQLYESGPNTGEFYGYLFSVNGSSSTDDATLSIAHEFPLTATYEDPFDTTEVSTDVAAVDPFGRIFDSTTGALIDGARVTIIDLGTGQPAQVFGIDGISNYPSTLISGGTVTDASGLVYDLSPGEFRFPLMFPGNYQLIVEAPGSYSAPSAATPAQIAALPNGPYIIAAGSFLGAFTVDGTGDVTFDVPLDPRSTLVVTKEASADTGAIGDFIRYEIIVENTGDSAAQLSIQDLMPQGFRYQAGSARREDGVIADPAIANDGETLTFQGGPLQSGESTSITYVAEITSGAVNGEAINRAFVVNGLGAAASNTGQAAVFIQEDLLRSRLTIAGRVAENACNPDDEWPREISDGKGVEGVRLYMETGAYVTTDEDGLFHFEDVEARTHVVQLDTVTIPDGYEVVQCENNTRYAGSAISQFVDSQGGSLWRANFYLRNKNAAAEIEDTTEEKATFSDATEYKNYDDSWLNLQTSETEFVYPAEGRTPSTRSLNLGLKHDPALKVKLMLNGQLAPVQNFGGRDLNNARTVALTRWRGVNLLDGENRFEAILMDKAGNEVERLERVITFVSTAARATLLPEKSRLIADGRRSPVIAVRITDGAGRPVHAGRLIPVEIDPPYRAKDLNRLEDVLPISAPLSAKTSTAIGHGGIALIELEPTLQTGKARFEVILDDGRQEEFTVLLKPELRDWIVVGLAEGDARIEKFDEMTGGDTPRNVLADGRVAVFAKGTVKGDWLITAAVDTANGRGDEDDELSDAIDPDARFPLYGDRSNQEFEAQSRYPVYLKAEKGGFQAVFGDYDTGLNESKLGKYTRRLSGGQAIYEGERFSISGFAAETNQDFMCDEIPADGTSGPFRLSVTPVVRNSETLVIESRNRFRPDVIEETTPLSRYLDYDIDFRTGEIILRLPLAAANNADSYNVIVADYETSAPVERNFTVGGRAAARFLKGRAEAGVTVIHEEGRPGSLDGDSDLAAVDLTYDVSETTELRLEYGASRREFDEGKEDGDAILAEVNHTSKNLNASAYYNETDDGYGLNQQSSGVSGVRRYGVEANYRFDTFDNEKSGSRGERFIDASTYREENLVTGANRTVSEVAVRQESLQTSGSVGFRRVVENTADDTKRKSLLATTAVRQSFDGIGLLLHASRDQPISSEDGSTLFPKRTTVGFDQRLFDKVTLSVSHEIQDGDTVSSANTIVGVKAEPWSGGSVTASADKITQDSGRRVGATLGVDQQIQINDKWSASFGVSRRQELESEGTISQTDDIVPDTPVSPLEDTEDFTSLFVGAGYRTDASTASARLEMRKSVLGTRYTSVLGAAREASESLSYAGAVRVEQNNNEITADERRIDARLGLAWRPRGEGLMAFNRFDIKQNRIDGELNSWKAVNNMALNAMLDERWQFSLNHGFKYSVIDTGGVKFDGITQLLGVETRFDITEKFDIGFRGMALYSHNSKTVDYSYGPSLGFSPDKNIWLSLGYNFSGFVDDDFTAADYSRNGLFIRLRIKFDQNTAKGLLDTISPDRVQ